MGTVCGLEVLWYLCPPKAMYVHKAMYVPLEDSHFRFLVIFTGPRLVPPLDLPLPTQGHTRHSPCSSLTQPQSQGGTLTSNLPPVCSLTVKKLVDLPWPPGKRNVLLKEISELRVVESQILKRNQRLEELIMLVFLHPFGWWKSFQTITCQSHPSDKRFSLWRQSSYENLRASINIY